MKWTTNVSMMYTCYKVHADLIFQISGPIFMCSRSIQNSKLLLVSIIPSTKFYDENQQISLEGCLCANTSNMKARNKKNKKLSDFLKHPAFCKKIVKLIPWTRKLIWYELLERQNNHVSRKNQLALKQNIFGPGRYIISESNSAHVQ